MGFTKSDEDTNLYYKVVNDEPLIYYYMLMARFLSEMRNLYYGVRRNSPLEGSWIDALLLGIRSMEEAERDFPRTRKIHHRDTEEIQNVGLQVHSYYDGCKFEEAEGLCFIFKFD